MERYVLFDNTPDSEIVTCRLLIIFLLYKTLLLSGKKIKS